MAGWILRQRRKTRIGHANGKLEQVIDDEGEKDEPAHRHAARGDGRLDHILTPVALGPGAAIFEHELDRVIDVDHDDDKEEGANDPENRPEIVQMLGVAVNPFRAEENLEVAEEMPDDEENQDDPGHRHDHLASDG